MANDAAKKKRRLGRGLDSLLASPVEVNVPSSAASNTEQIQNAPSTEHVESAEPAATATVDPEAMIHQLPVARIRPNARQPRQVFDASAIAALAESIRTDGLMQPIVVRPAREDGVHELVAGERRWRAVQHLGLETIPAIIRSVDDRQAAVLALVENLQREDLNPLERARAFQRLIDDFQWTHVQVAERVGLNRASVSNHLRLLELDPQTTEAIEQGMVSFGQARALAAIADVRARRKVMERAIRGEWSVRKLEQAIRSLNEPARDGGASSSPSTDTGPDPRQAHLEDLQRRLGDRLGTRVIVQPGRSRGSGRLVIEFYDHDQFEGLLDRLGVDLDER